MDEPKINPYYTICLNVKGKKCVVVGGGEVARRKAATLSDSGARVIVISPMLDSVLEYMAFQKEVEWKQSRFDPALITDDVFVAIAATDNRDVNHQIAEICKGKRILCNVVDESDEGSFIVPSMIERGPLTIAISTSGISPTLAAAIRQELEMAYGEEYGQFLELMASLRPVILEQFRNPMVRQKVFDRMVSSRALSLLRNGLKEAARKELQEIIEEAKDDPSLSGGGPLPIVNP